jgi:hypothetical protein
MTVYNVVSRIFHVYLGLIVCCICIISSIGSIIFSKKLLQKRCTWLAAASDTVYQLLSHCQWFSPGTPAFSTTKTGRHDIAEILLKVVLNTKNNQLTCVRWPPLNCTPLCGYTITWFIPGYTSILSTQMSLTFILKVHHLFRKTSCNI